MADKHHKYVYIHRSPNGSVQKSMGTLIRSGGISSVGIVSVKDIDCAGLKL